MPLGIYISIPFCQSKCSYCNFASDVFSRSRMAGYVSRLTSDIEAAADRALAHNLHFHPQADTVYLGGGTPSTLDPGSFADVFRKLRQNVDVLPDAEITVECAPGTLSDAMFETFRQCGVNRISFGAQSFIDKEISSVGRLHSREQTLADIARARAGGITNINLDLIAGLPYQTAASWRESVARLVDTGVPHASVYILEVDEDSRLGRELIAGGNRYHAHHVPDGDLCADLYVDACETLRAAGLEQYEISNFARDGCMSKHNTKYWERRPYLGFGLDAHSMLLRLGGPEAVRFAAPDDLNQYLESVSGETTIVDRRQAMEECFFLGLRMNRGVDLRVLAGEFGEPSVASFRETIAALIESGLLSRLGERLALTDRGRLLSNEVFSRFLADPPRTESSASTTNARTA